MYRQQHNKQNVCTSSCACKSFEVWPSMLKFGFVSSRCATSDSKIVDVVYSGIIGPIASEAFLIRSRHEAVMNAVHSSQASMKAFSEDANTPSSKLPMCFTSASDSNIFVSCGTCSRIFRRALRISEIFWMLSSVMYMSSAVLAPCCHSMPISVTVRSFVVFSNACICARSLISPALLANSVILLIAFESSFELRALSSSMITSLPQFGAADAAPNCGAVQCSTSRL